MRRHRPTSHLSRALTVLAAVALSVMTATGIADEAAQTEKQLQQVRSRIQSLKTRIDRDQTRRGDLSQALSKAEQEIATLSKRLRESRNAIAERERQLQNLDDKRAQQSNALGTQLDQLGRQVRAAYETGQQGKLRLLLSQVDPATLGRMLVYHDYYADAQTQAIASLRKELGALLATRSQIKSQRNALESARQSQSQLLAGLQQSRREREKALQTVERALAGSGQELKTLKSDEKQLQELVESLRSRLADIPVATPKKSFAEYKGRLPPPVAGPVIAAFGQPKSGGQLNWQGVWLGAKAGTPVKAVASGRVVYVGQMHRYGLIVILDHGKDYYTIYGHVQAAYVEVGQWADARTPIAAAGTSGGHKTSGVYFEVRKGKTPVNPSTWVGS